jgi:hypothetical protein
MAMKHRQATVGTLCPDDETHGPLLAIDGALLCINQKHDDARTRAARTPERASSVATDTDASSAAEQILLTFGL